MNNSPTKRRALGSLDANCQSPTPNKLATLGQTKAPLIRDANNSSDENDNKNNNNNIGNIVDPLLNKHKRAMAETDAPQKRRRTASLSLGLAASGESLLVRHDSELSASPEPSSVFDSSAIDTSQATCNTELDIEAPIASPPRPSRRSNMTREEARHKAEVLRLRLGLAGYKLRTGQENIPLEHLQVRPVPGDTQQRQPLRSARPREAGQGRQGTGVPERDSSIPTTAHVGLLPAPPQTS